MKQTKLASLQHTFTQTQQTLSFLTKLQGLLDVLSHSCLISDSCPQKRDADSHIERKLTIMCWTCSKTPLQLCARCSDLRAQDDVMVCWSNLPKLYTGAFSVTRNYVTDTCVLLLFKACYTFIHLSLLNTKYVKGLSANYRCSSARMWNYSTSATQ